MIKIDLIKNPEKLNRIGNPIKLLCTECGKFYTWDGICRKCRKKLLRKYYKEDLRRGYKK